MQLPKFSLDPSKIKDRWGLAATILIVWVIVTYFVLSSTTIRLEISLSVLVLTLLLLLPTLMLSFKSDGNAPSKPPPNIPSRGESTIPDQMPTAQEIQYLHRLVKLSQVPEIKEVLKELKKTK